jgi:hypothetical protein
LTSALVGGEWSASLADSFTLKKGPPVPTGRRLGGPQSRCGRLEEEEILTQPGLEFRPLWLAIPNARSLLSLQIYRIRENGFQLFLATSKSPIFHVEHLPSFDINNNNYNKRGDPSFQISELAFEIVKKI